MEKIAANDRATRLWLELENLAKWHSNRSKIVGHHALDFDNLFGECQLVFVKCFNKYQDRDDADIIKATKSAFQFKIRSLRTRHLSTFRHLENDYKVEDYLDIGMDFPDVDEEMCEVPAELSDLEYRIVQCLSGHNERMQALLKIFVARHRHINPNKEFRIDSNLLSHVLLEPKEIVDAVMENLKLTYAKEIFYE